MDRKCGCVLLAGGAGSRMGYVNKASLLYKGTTFGWYSVNCLDALKEDIEAGKYKLLKLLEKVRLRVLDASATGIDEKQFANINSEEDYRKVCQLPERKHILICGKKQSGKTTLINRIIMESRLPVYGYRTQMERSPEDGCGHVYMYPAGSMGGPRSRENEVGITGGSVKSVNSDVFNGLGCALLEAARDNGMIVMDEIGYMEDRAEKFCKAVTAAFDGDIPILASIKDTDRGSAHIQKILAHPKAQVFRLNPENREEVYEEIRSIVKTWGK